MKPLKKIICVILIFLLASGLLLCLNRKAKDTIISEETYPPVADTASYVVLNEGDDFQVYIEPVEDISIDGFELLIVNTDMAGSGILTMSLSCNGDELWNGEISENAITAGSWLSVDADVDLISGNSYTMTFDVKGFSPYFIQTSQSEIENSLGFKEVVITNGSEANSGISLGYSQSYSKELKFGDIFYLSRFVVVLFAIIGTILIIATPEKVCEQITKIVSNANTALIINDILLLLIFIVLSIYIFNKGYIDSIYITSDSAGYLREAVNMANGNGFSYDGLSGYDSWFANWPIIYPAMIALVMVVTKTEAYLASKILSIVLVGIILLVMRLAFKDKAWAYSLALVNTGFITIAYTTWSELPFMLFMLGFGLIFAKVIQDESVSVKNYVLLALLLIATELTRYFGIYLWVVTGLFILSYGYKYIKTKNNSLRNKCIGLVAVDAAGFVVYMGYMMLNKIMNGMASGVSRRMWWDDYETLTKDLIDSLVTEIFNIFNAYAPQYIANLDYAMKALFVMAVLATLIIFAIKNSEKNSLEAVLFTMAAVYYGMFIVIRYFSSMDTFYYRFFEPATFLITIALIGIIVKNASKMLIYLVQFLILIIAIANAKTFVDEGYLSKEPYYNVITRAWDEEYKEIPQKSVIIFNDNDYRSTYYRADIIDGTIEPADTCESIAEKYYGSDYLCIKAEFAKVMIEDGGYNDDVEEMLSEGLMEKSADAEYIVISMK